MIFRLTQELFLGIIFLKIIPDRQKRFIIYYLDYNIIPKEGRLKMRRTVITGLGVSCGIGKDIPTFQKNLQEMRSGIKKITTFDTTKYRANIGSTIPDIDENLPQSDHELPRPMKFLISATQQAINDSGLQHGERKRTGCYFSGPACSIFELENFYKSYKKGGLMATSPSDLAYSNWDSTVTEICYRYGIQGPRNTVLSACSSSGLTLGLGMDLIKLGEVDMMLVGGADGFSDFTYSGFHALNSVSQSPCKPFDKDRDGLSFGEGAGVIILEDYEHAKKRGAPIYAELVGFGAIGEAYRITAPHPEAFGYIKSMEKALEEGKVSPEEIGHINSHGTATLLNDQVESKAIQVIFKDHPVMVNSIKSLVGHCMGAAGAVEAISTILSLRQNFVPGTKNLENVDPTFNINVLKKTVDTKFNYALCNSAGFGGNHSSLLFKRM